MELAVTLLTSAGRRREVLGGGLLQPEGRIGWHYVRICGDLATGRTRAALVDEHLYPAGVAGPYDLARS